MIKRTHRLTQILFLALVSIFLALSAHAITFNITYDTSVTNIGTLTQVQTAFGAAAQTIQSLYTNPITINITVYAANTGPFGDVDLGASNTKFTGNSSTFIYKDLTNALKATRTTLADTNSVASLPGSDPTPSGRMWWMPRAEAKALGVLNVSANATNVDGEIGFATNVDYTFDLNNRAVLGEYDFIGIAQHEITEVMGRTTFNLSSTNFTTYDLFRFTNNGARSFNPGATNAYFSVDNGATALNYFYTNVNFGDIQDWLSGTRPDSFDAYVFDGDELTLSAADLISLDILGYRLNYQPPRLKAVTSGNGAIQLNFTNTPGTTYTVLSSTNLSLPVSSWTILGTTSETLAGQFQFTDAQAMNDRLRFYRVRLN